MEVTPITLPEVSYAIPEIKTTSEPQLASLPSLSRINELTISFISDLSVLKSVTSFEEFIKNTTKFMQNRFNRYKTLISLLENEYEIDKLTKYKDEGISTIRSILSKHGIKLNNSITGYLFLDLTDAMIADNLKQYDLIYTYHVKTYDTILKFILEIIDYIKNINNKLVDIKSKDYTTAIKALSLEAYMLMSELEKELSNIMLNMEATSAELERYKLDLSRLILDSEKKTIETSINTAKAFATQSVAELTSAMNNYKLALMRFNMLKEETLRILFASNKAKIALANSIISKVNSLNKMIGASIDKYNQYLDSIDTQIKTDLTMMEIDRDKLNSFKAKLDADRAIVESKYTVNQALYDQLRASIRMDLASLTVEDVNIMNRLIEFKKDLLSDFEAMNLERDLALGDLATELSLRNQSATNEAIFKIQLNTLSDIIRESLQSQVSATGIVSNAIADWYRTCAVTSARITAAYYRSYS